LIPWVTPLKVFTLFCAIDALNAIGTLIVIVFPDTLKLDAPTVHWLLDNVVVYVLPLSASSIIVCVCA
jgi:hypothetical protein